ncbi:MAG: hypothetical protein R3284_02840 [Rubricoccaceae bacterium]|nr:hypothetical protein [Rubricoccaceae bacterium]
MSLQVQNPNKPTVSALSEVLTLRHRGFSLTVRTMPGRFGKESFGYSVLHRGHILHESGGDYGTAEAADRAARRLIDDAIGVYDDALFTDEPLIDLGR